MGDLWYAVQDGDERALGLYRRHYSSARRRHDAPRQFVGPGEKYVLLTVPGDALFVWRRSLYRQDEQIGVNCAVFRNEGGEQSSSLITEAMSLAWDRWAGKRLFTFVDPTMVVSRNPGYCFKCAGWRFAGVTRKGLHILEVLPAS